VSVHVVAAPDKFKGTVSAPEVVAAIGRAATAVGASCDAAPMSDGGEGFIDALGGPNRTMTVSGPLGDPVEAPWRFSHDRAVIEMAAAAGLTLVGGPERNDPIAASTHGVGELIAMAVESGARRVLVGVGGSATTDGGLGALRALFPLARYRAVDLVVATDVRTKFVDAAEVFAPQKGARPAQVELLRRRLERLAGAYLDDYGVDVRNLEGSGAAGGLAGGLAAIGAELESGFEVVADEVKLYERIEAADLVVTGEGFLDAESFDGKVVGGVCDLAREADVPVLAIVGEAFDDVDQRVETIALVERFGKERSLRDTVACIEEVVAERLRKGVSGGG
jgi:glycerate kinase